MSFSSLGLAPSLADAAAEAGYTVPTPVQSAAIPAILGGRDVLALAPTGSGKTAAFALPLLQAMLRRPGGARQVRALIVVPTRELAAQVGEVLSTFARALAAPVKVSVAFGGVSINPQMMDLRGGADIMVATPGRLLDLIDHNALKLSAVTQLVFDEADRLLELGFADEMGRILELVPAQRQQMLFSATFAEPVLELAGKLLRDPVRIEVDTAPRLDESAAPATPAILQRAISVDEPARTRLLRRLLKEERWERVLVFVATRYAAMHVADKLQRNGIAADALHGDASQGARTAVLAAFKAGKVQVLVATDVAARGIDITQLPVVVNYDLPRSADDYTHRIGRTGRAGSSGVAVSFVTPESEAHFRLIEKRHGIRVPREVVAGLEPAEPAPAAPASVTDTVNGGVKGRRKSKKDKLREAAAQHGGQPREE
jgi:superfamily II DNA/RNA helicase